MGRPRFGRVNLATGAGGGGRPAGSAFKTFALVAALEQGIPPEAVFAAPDRLVVGRHGRGRPGGSPTTRARLRARHPALGHRPVDQHRLRRAAAAPQDHADAWFVGFTPSLAAAAWVGYPQGQVPMVPPRTAGRVSGGTWPAAIWAGFMRAALAGRPRQGFPRPDTRLVQVALDVERGCLPNRFTPAAEVASLVYLKAAAPTRTAGSPRGRWPGWSRRWSACPWPGRPAGWRRPGCRWPSGCGWTARSRRGRSWPSRRPAGRPGRPGPRSP